MNMAKGIDLTTEHMTALQFALRSETLSVFVLWSGHTSRVRIEEQEKGPIVWKIGKIELQGGSRTLIEEVGINRHNHEPHALSSKKFQKSQDGDLGGNKVLQSDDSPTIWQGN